MHLKKTPGPAPSPIRNAVCLPLLLSTLVLASCASRQGASTGVPPALGSAVDSAIARSLDSTGSDRRAPDRRYDLARNLLEAERYGEALAIYDELLSANPRDDRALDGRGVVLDMTGRHAEAREAYRAALAVRPDALSTRNNLGLSLVLDGHADDAIAVLREVASQPDATARHRQNLALAYGLAGYDEAAAAVAAVDLGEREVAENLDFYRIARGIRQETLASAVTGFPEPR